MKRALILCDGARPPLSLQQEHWDVQQAIKARGEDGDLNISISAPAATFDGLTARCADLLHIAAYAFAADQQVRRGGPADIYGDDWRRLFALCVPVAEPAFWADERIVSQLAEVLSFASDDEWRFYFVQAPQERAPQVSLEIDPGETLGSPDIVVLFSGGLDSLCAAVEQCVLKRRRPLLVSHSPAFHVRARQAALRGELRTRFRRRWHFPLVSGAVHRRSSDAPESTQRTRSFLYATLGVVAAEPLGLHEVHLADNGVVSLNLPINDQLQGAQATRSTHPKFIRLYNHLLAAVFPEGPRVLNPLWDRTRAETLGVLEKVRATALIDQTNSCSHTRGKTGMQPHCGVCSQCIDRRFATLAAGLEEFDPADRYEADIFTHSLREGPARTMAYSYVRHASEISEMNGEEMFRRFTQLFDCIDPRDPRQQDTVESLTAMVCRHGEEVMRVMEEQIARSKRALARQKLPADCLVALVAAQGPTSEREGAVFCASPDYREVSLRGNKFALSTNQARVVELMHRHQSAGDLSMGQGYVLEELGIKSKSLYQVFRGSSAWGALIVKAEGKGLFRLNS